VKADLIVVGAQYVVSLKWDHVLIPGQIVERFVNETLTEANRPPDDDWEPLA
jgi:hypothetical protein